MSLINKKSIFDRHNRNELGLTVGNDGQGPLPNQGNYYAEHDETGFTNSPFTGTGDHMVDLLNNNVTTTTGNTYQPAPNQSQFQDIEGIDIASNTPPKYEDNLPS